MHRVADLGVAGLIGLDARQRLLEQVVVGAVGHRRHRHELQVGEAGLEHEVELDRAVDCVGGEEHVVEQVTGGENHPLVGMEGLVCPVEVAVVGQHVVADQQRDLGVPDLVERAQARHHPPGAVAAEPRHPQFCDRAGVLHESNRAVVELDQLHPTGIEAVEQVWLVQRRPHAEHCGVLLALVCDVFAVGGAVSLVPVAPRIMCQPGVAAEFFRKHLPLIDIAGCPVDLAG